MGGVGVFKLGATLVKRLVLLFFFSAPRNHGAVPMLDHFVKEKLQIGVTLA